LTAPATAWALIPAKGFDRAKSRLNPTLAPMERAALARRLLLNALAAAAGCPAVAGALVITDCERVADLARERGAEALLDPPGAGLAAAIAAGMVALAARGVDAAVVLMADLPLLGAGDVGAMLAALEAADVALAPDGEGEGTNALATRLPTQLPLRFGRYGSFRAHVEAAEGLAVAVVRRVGLALDVDGPAHLMAIAAVESG
jgi:2-phospho-L-lactate guanylyltransferase